MTTTNEPTETINNYNVIIDNEVEALDLLTQELTGQAGGDRKSSDYENIISDIVTNDNEVEALDLLTQELTGKPGNPTGTNQHSECGISDIITNSTFDSEVEAIDTTPAQGNGENIISDIVTNDIDSEVEAINTNDGYGNAVNTITDIISNGTFDSEVEAINTSDGYGNGE